MNAFFFPQQTMVALTIDFGNVFGNDCVKKGIHSPCYP
jgi:hypothetical protein